MVRWERCEDIVNQNTHNTTMIYKTLHRNLKIEQYEPHKNWARTQMLQKGKQVTCAKPGIIAEVYESFLFLFNVLHFTLTGQ
jgi:hypothetical protein